MRNIFQASAFHSKDVQGKPDGGSTRRCVQVATYFDVVIKNPLLRIFSSLLGIRNCYLQV
jgi:hypothetical protein